MWQQAWVDQFAGGDLLGHDLSEFPGVPIDYYGGQQVKACNPVFLTFGRTVSDFTAPFEADCAFQRVMCFAFVETDLDATLQINIAQPVEHEDRALQAEDFPQCQRQAVLAWIGCQFAQYLAWNHGSGNHACGKPENVGPIFPDRPNVYPSANKRLKRRRHSIRSGRINPLIREITDSRCKPEALNGTDRKNMICKAAGIDIMLTDLPTCIILQEAIENIRCFVRGRRNDLRGVGERPKSDRLAPKVMASVAEGRSYRWIARDLGISKNTAADIAKRNRVESKNHE